jgi:hypothetical protein
LTQNEENIHSEIKEVEKVDSNILLDDDRSFLKPSQQSEQDPFYHSIKNKLKMPKRMRRLQNSIILRH